MNTFLLALALENIGKSDIIMLSAISIVSTILLVFVGYKLLQILQLTGYKLKGFFTWFKETKASYFSRLFMLTFLSVSSILMTNVLLVDFFVINIFKYSGILFFFLFSSLFITNLFSAKQKTPLRYTKRMTRFVVVYAIVTFVFSIITELFGYFFIPYLSYGFIAVMPIILPVVVLISYFITYPIERIISGNFVRRAKAKLSAQSDTLVIGITGSYGKTTIKNILGTILSEKFRVCISPSSYNTPLGLSKTILQNLKSDDEIFIAEMGAKQKYDIEELCNIVSPDIGVITSIGNQHLLTFGSVENIISTKGELAEFITKNNGKLFICTESKGAQKLAENYPAAVCVSLAGENQLEIKNISTSKDGSTFVICCHGESIPVKTILLGEHNILNILLASNVALSLGLTLKEIAAGIEKLVSIPHRLEIIKSSSTYTIIDDSYNSSVEGSKASLNVLSKFDNNKFIITPGIVELGDEQFNANFELGRDMAKVANFVIIDSTINYDAISSGLIFAGFDESKILQAGSLNQAVELLGMYAAPSDVVLFENDLPDNYN